MDSRVIAVFAVCQATLDLAAYQGSVGNLDTRDFAVLAGTAVFAGYRAIQVSVDYRVTQVFVEPLEQGQADLVVTVLFLDTAGSVGYLATQDFAD